MFKIRQLHNVRTMQDSATLAAVIKIYEEAFPYYTQYSSQIAKLITAQKKSEYEVILLVAEGTKNRVLGFTLSFYFPEQKFAYLDYVVSNLNKGMRGYGGALYEKTRKTLRQNKCVGIFMDVPPDEQKNANYKILDISQNRKRMAFYESFGALPITGTKYNIITTKANQGYNTELVYDSLGGGGKLTAIFVRNVVTTILKLKANINNNDPQLKEILHSIQDDTINLRLPRYQRKDQEAKLAYENTGVLHLVYTENTGKIHHIKEKGYVERPARIESVLKGLENFNIKTHKIKHFPEKHILEVHSRGMYSFLKKSKAKLKAGELIYPNVFLPRDIAKIPEKHEISIGYYCTDTFTPLTNNVYDVARNAVNAGLTGADILAATEETTYVLTRPPGHHAGINMFGGFCYFNTAAIAANYLSKLGKVVLLDIDYHHGNGSQNIFYHRKDVCFISIHGHPNVAYPHFLGYKDELGHNEGIGYNHNYPLYPEVNDDRYLHILSHAMNKIIKFQPHYLVISLGYDIIIGDPTGMFSISVKGMQKIGEKLAALKLPILIVQEGGYSLRNLKLGATKFFYGLLR